MPQLLLPAPPSRPDGQGPGVQPPRLFCTFHLGDQLFGVEITDVKEVNTETCLTRIHHAPPQVLGCVNLRGQIYLVLDIRQMLGLAPAQIGPDSRLLIFKPHVGDALAALVDQIGDIVAVRPDRIEQKRPGDERYSAGELIGGIAQLDRELLLILQASQFQHVIEKAM
jgi:purine-binding chemotaxis protein CheW